MLHKTDWFDNYTVVHTCDDCAFRNKGASYHVCDECYFVFASGGNQYSRWQEVSKRTKNDIKISFYQFIYDLKLYLIDWYRYFICKYVR